MQTTLGEQTLRKRAVNAKKWGKYTELEKYCKATDANPYLVYKHALQRFNKTRKNNALPRIGMLAMSILCLVADCPRSAGLLSAIGCTGSDGLRCIRNIEAEGLMYRVKKGFRGFQARTGYYITGKGREIVNQFNEIQRKILEG